MKTNNSLTVETGDDPQKRVWSAIEELQKEVDNFLNNRNKHNFEVFKVKLLSGFKGIGKYLSKYPVYNPNYDKKDNRCWYYG